VFRIVAMFVVIDLESILHVVCKCTVFASYLFTKILLSWSQCSKIYHHDMAAFRKIFHGCRDIIKTLQKQRLLNVA
jgi:hypothetical protein